MNAEHLAERLSLLGRDQDVRELASDHLVAREAGGPLARVVEEQHPPVLVQHADERLRRLREHAGELVAELEAVVCRGVPIAGSVSLAAGFCKFLTLRL